MSFLFWNLVFYGLDRLSPSLKHVSRREGSKDSHLVNLTKRWLLQLVDGAGGGGRGWEGVKVVGSSLVE